MSRILITRPLPAGKQLVHRLRLHGKRVWYLPLVNVFPGKDLAFLVQRLSSLSTGDLLFIVSQNALHYAHACLLQQDTTWPTRLNYYAVGRNTGIILHKLSGLSVHYPYEGETSEDLLRLPTLEHINGHRALILRGNIGRGLLGNTLRRRGAKTEYCECYQRRTIDYNGEEQVRRLISLRVDTLVMTSGEMLKQFYHLIPIDYRESWLMRCRIVVVSKRLATLAKKFGWIDIVIANGANNDALMQVLL